MTYTILDIYTEYIESKPRGRDSLSFSEGGGVDSVRYPLGILISLLLLFSGTQSSSAQRKSDIGLIGGTAYYLGDVNHSRVRITSRGVETNVTGSGVLFYRNNAILPMVKPAEVGDLEPGEGQVFLLAPGDLGSGGSNRFVLELGS